MASSRALKTANQVVSEVKTIEISANTEQANKEICARKGRMFGGCRFEPRYDSRPDAYALRIISRISGIIIGKSLETAIVKVYRGDVCVLCGKTVNTRDRQA